ncbi:MAG: EcsC family protein [Lachnospiraceae bacterium]|nr:EcsC family protein [Lachnospiraceae bacterium]
MVNQKHLDREWHKLLKAEKSFLNRNFRALSGNWQEKIEKYVPEKFQSTLDKTFLKAFDLIFEKGTPVIEKTYNREKMEQDYKILEFVDGVKNNGSSLRAFGKHAAKSRMVNQAISAAEGVGMGVLGMGLPDIPLFLGVLLKSIYEIALSYGYAYDTMEERIFILQLMETALLREKDLLKADLLINQQISKVADREITLEEQKERTAKALADEMLYLKFIQGIPVAGIAGGISDVVYQKKITDYAALKYKRRFLYAKHVKGTSYGTAT